MDNVTAITYAQDALRPLRPRAHRHPSRQYGLRGRAKRAKGSGLSLSYNSGMARPLRLEFDNALYHVTSRGDRREDIFWSDADRVVWLDLLGQVCKRFNWRVYAYCLMSNHYHLLVQTPDGNLSAGMRQLNGVYTQRSNQSHSRSGHVFQGRFKAILVDQESYLLELARYVVLNPVRAGMVSDTHDWPWSSYRITVAPPNVPKPDWLASDTILRLFESGKTLKDRSKAQQRYIDHVRAGVGLPSVWDALQGQVFLGDDRFVKKMMTKLAAAQTEKPSSQWREVPVKQRKAVKKQLQAYEAEHANDRNAAIQAAFASGQYTMHTLGEHFGLHYTSVSRIVKQGEVYPDHQD
jgi:putative transposase